MRFLSRTTASTIWAIAAPGAKKALLPTNSVISAPPRRVRATMLSMRSEESRCASGIPPAWANRGSGTMSLSVCAPMTIPCTSCTETPTSLARKAGDLVGQVRHRIQRVGDDDQDRLRGAPAHLLDDPTHDAGVGVQQLFPRHARLPGHAGDDDDDFRVRRLLISVAAGDTNVHATNRRRLRQVQGLAHRHLLNNVHQDQVGYFLRRQPLRRGMTDHARPDDADFRPVDHLAPQI